MRSCSESHKFGQLVMIFILHQQIQIPMQWNSQELRLLQSFRNLEPGTKWKNLVELFESKGFRKNEMECKRKWMQLYNEDPNIESWTEDELQILFRLYEVHGSQWSMIHKSISSKNKIQIRNKFYGTLRNLIRILLEYFEVSSGQITAISNKIRPQALQKLYNSSQEFSFCEGAVKDVVALMNFAIDKERLIFQVSKNEGLYLKIVNTIQSRKLKPKNKMPEQQLKYTFDHMKEGQKQIYGLRAESSCQQLASTENRKQQVADDRQREAGREDSNVASPASMLSVWLCLARHFSLTFQLILNIVNLAVKPFLKQ